MQFKQETQIKWKAIESSGTEAHSKMLDIK